MHAVANIEFCHIYTDEEFGEEQTKSINLLQDIAEIYKKERKPFVTSVFIDNLNVKEEKWGMNDFLKQMNDYGVAPDMIGFEANFTTVAEKIIENVPSKFKRTEFFRRENKYVLFFDDGKRKFALKDIYSDSEHFKCVILSCSWLLCKLGVLKYPKNGVVQLNSNIVLHSNEIVSILSKKYEKVESNVLHLLSSLGLKEEIKRIKYVFY